jgi:hypothetical protein
VHPQRNAVQVAPHHDGRLAAWLKCIAARAGLRPGLFCALILAPRGWLLYVLQPIEYLCHIGLFRLTQDR